MERIEEVEIPQIAYEPEGHDIVIAGLQTMGALMERPVLFVNRGMVEEEGLEWYILITRVFGENTINDARLLALDCNPNLIDGLRKRQILLEVFHPDIRPEVCFGRKEFPIAAILSRGNKPIYKSPGFDLDEYLRVI